MKTFSNILIVLGLIIFLYFGIQFLFLILMSVFFFFYNTLKKIFKKEEEFKWETADTEICKIHIEYLEEILKLSYSDGSTEEEILKNKDEIKKFKDLLENKKKQRIEKYIIIVGLILSYFIFF